MSALARNASKPDRQKTTHPRREPLGPPCLLRRRGAARLSDYSGRDHTEAQPVHPNWSTARTPGPGLSNTPEGHLSRVISRVLGDHIRQIPQYSARMTETVGRPRWTSVHRAQHRGGSHRASPGGGPGRLPASSEAVGLPGRPGATPAWPEGDFPAHINLADSPESSNLSELSTNHEQIGDFFRYFAVLHNKRIRRWPLATYSSAKLLTPTTSSLSELSTNHEQIGDFFRYFAVLHNKRIRRWPSATYSSAKLLTPTGC